MPPPSFFSRMSLAEDFTQLEEDLVFDKLVLNLKVDAEKAHRELIRGVTMKHFKSFVLVNKFTDLTKYVSFQTKSRITLQSPLDDVVDDDGDEEDPVMKLESKDIYFKAIHQITRFSPYVVYLDDAGIFEKLDSIMAKNERVLLKCEHYLYYN